MIIMEEQKNQIYTQLYVHEHDDGKIVMEKFTSGKPGDCECDQKCTCGWVYIGHIEYAWSEAVEKYSEKFLKNAKYISIGGIASTPGRSFDYNGQYQTDGFNCRIYVQFAVKEYLNGSMVVEDFVMGNLNCQCSKRCACFKYNIGHMEYSWEKAIGKYSTKFLNDAHHQYYHSPIPIPRCYFN